MQRSIAASLTGVLVVLVGAAGAAERATLESICGECRVERFATCGGFLEGATFDRNGVLWAVDLLSGNVLRVDDRGQCTVEATTGGSPNGAKFHRDGRLFIADKDRGVLAYDPATREMKVIADAYRAERLRGLNDLVFDADGGLYFSEPYGSSVLDPDGRVFYLPPGENAALTVAYDGIAFPNGVALSANGANLYIGEFAARRILSVPSIGSRNAFDVAHVAVEIEGGIGPDGFAFDTAGNLYAAVFQGGEIRVFDPQRFAIGSIRLPDGAGNGVTNLAFKDNQLYITEGSQGTIWRVAVRNRGLPLFHQRGPGGEG